ncbi:MAG: hypothetical protein ACR5LG_13355 [Sodalis sp. (in: enterobacteria)]|uniref:hypothetical protein n=1 Tax=Sodalis sp. (in: enterobacteria) TaxID=1898979 RepID=UPI003F3F6CAC
MTATTQDRNTPYRDGELRPYPVAKKETIPAGVIVCLKGGYAVNGQGGNGDQYIVVRRHKAFLWENYGRCEAGACRQAGLCNG